MVTTIRALCVVLKASGSLGGNTEKQHLVSLPELKYWSANVSEMITLVRVTQQQPTTNKQPTTTKPNNEKQQQQQPYQQLHTFLLLLDSNNPQTSYLALCLQPSSKE